MILRSAWLIAVTIATVQLLTLTWPFLFIPPGNLTPHKNEGGFKVSISNFATLSQRTTLNKPAVGISNLMRPNRIKDTFSRVFSRFSQNCKSRAATRAICEKFENASENISLILRGLDAITCL